MILKLIALIMMAVCVAQSAVPSRRKEKENVAALFVKASSSGQLRFFGAGLKNQFITNKHGFLDQFRPIDTDTDYDDIPETVIDTNTNTPTDTETDIANAGNDVGTGNRRRRGGNKRRRRNGIKVYIIRLRRN